MRTPPKNNYNSLQNSNFVFNMLYVSAIMGHNQTLYKIYIKGDKTYIFLYFIQTVDDFPFGPKHVGYWKQFFFAINCSGLTLVLIHCHTQNTTACHTSKLTLAKLLLCEYTNIFVFIVLNTGRDNLEFTGMWCRVSDINVSGGRGRETCRPHFQDRRNSPPREPEITNKQSNSLIQPSPSFMTDSFYIFTKVLGY
jgi:hypothetical protein